MLDKNILSTLLVLGKTTSNCRGGTSDTYSMMQKYNNRRVFGEDEKLNYC